MKEFFRKLLTRFTGLWAGWSNQQRGILVGVFVLVLVGIITLFSVSSTPVMIPVIDFAVTDEDERNRIIARINEENVRVTVSPGGIIQVPDEAAARRIRAILIRENLIPTGASPWQVFAKDRWTYTDFERNINLQEAQRRMIIDHLRAIDDIDNVEVNIAWPPERFFRSDQYPVTVAVTITPSHGSDLIHNRRKIEGIHRLIHLSIPELSADNIAISDNRGNLLNDFRGLEEWDRQSLIEREQRFILDLERRYSNLVLSSLQDTFSSDRVRDLNVRIEMDLSKMIVNETVHSPVIMKEQTQGLPYDDSERLPSLTISSSTSETTWSGFGFNPEGPAGVESQMPPSFRDASTLHGHMSQTTQTLNEVINTRNIQEVRSPQSGRRTVSVNIDGIWEMGFDEKGNPVVLPNGTIERVYTPIPVEELRRAELLIRDAIGFDPARRDSVTVTNIPFDRREEFRIEDAAYFRQKQIRTTIIVFISGLILLLFGFILVRMISREMERRRRLAEEERARREQMLRESAMAEAEQDGMEVSISLEERSRMELMESVINMAKEHPEDAAQLIRTWILEE